MATSTPYEVSADPLAPGKYGKQHFLMNESGVTHVSDTGPANASDAVALRVHASSWFLEQRKL